MFHKTQKRIPIFKKKKKKYIKTIVKRHLQNGLTYEDNILFHAAQIILSKIHPSDNEKTKLYYWIRIRYVCIIFYYITL